MTDKFNSDPWTVAARQDHRVEEERRAYGREIDAEPYTVEQLRAEIQRGIDSGPSIEASVVFASVRDCIAKLAAEAIRPR